MTFNEKKEIPQEEQNKFDDFEDFEDVPQNYYNGNDYVPSIDSDTKLNDKLISSGNSKKKIIIQKPIFKTLSYIIPAKNKDGKFLKQNGFYIPKVYKKDILTLVDVEEIEVKFPIEDAFNDSRTSSFITEQEKRLLFSIDDVAISLWIEQFNNPSIDHNMTLNKLYWYVSSITDNSKGFSGAAAEMAKKTINISESSVKDMREAEVIIERQKQNKKGGLLGGAVIPGYL